jgi:peptidoglycan/LPS O-acetylase OafA/YrhL
MLLGSELPQEQLRMNRLIQLDVLRFAAVALVMARHMTVCPPDTSLVLNRITETLARGGWIGVDLFFVLSGFLISGLLFREYRKFNAIDIKRFLIRRGFKIYPSFWLLLIITLVVFYLSSTPIRLQPSLGEILFFQNYIGSFWSHTWSLAVEEHFYIGLSILFVIILRFWGKYEGNAFRYIPVLFLLIAIACLALRLLTTAYIPFSHGKHIFPTHLRIDSLFFGVLISYYWYFKGLAEATISKPKKVLIFICGLLLLSPAFIFEVEDALWIVPFGLIMFYLGSGCLLLTFLKTDLAKNRIAVWVSYVGAYSYSLYLWHLPLQNWLPPLLKTYWTENWFVYLFVYVPTALVVGIGASKLVEYPILRIRDFYYPSGPASPRIDNKLPQSPLTSTSEAV